MASDQVSLDSLGPEELAHVRQQLETEVNSLLQNAVALQQTATMFAAAGQAVENLQKQEPGTPRGAPSRVAPRARAPVHDPELPSMTTRDLCTKSTLQANRC